MRVHLLLILLVAILAPRTARCQEAPLTRIEVGEIVGGQFTENRYFLYVEPSAGPLSQRLWRDEVVQLARAALVVGQNYGFSLDFLRRGTKPFKTDDINDYRAIVKLMAQPDQKNPVLAALHQRLGTPRVPEPAAEPSKAALRQLVDALNLIRQDQAILSRVHSEDLSVEAGKLLKTPNDKRVGRFVIEDLLGPTVSHDIERKYVKAYKPAYSNTTLQSIFDSTRSEAVLMAGDTWLKYLAGDGGKTPPGLSYGPQEVSLCAEEARAFAEQRLEMPSGQHQEYFTLELNYAAPPDLPGNVVWFKESRLAVKTYSADDGSAPDCSDRFAASLTKNVPHLENYDGKIGSDLRDLRELLVLNRAIAYFAGITDLDEAYLESIPTERIEDEPPPVVETPIRFGARGQVFGYRTSGGVELNSNPSFSAGRDEAPAKASPTNGHQGGPHVEPGFVLTTVNVGGRKLVRVDLTSILRPESSQ